MAYDPANGGQLVLFGGYNGTYLERHLGLEQHHLGQVDNRGDTTCTTACTASPPARNGAVDGIRPGLDGQLVLFGGDVHGLDSDTWAWNATTSPGPSSPRRPAPPPRISPAWPTTRPPARWCCSVATAPALLRRHLGLERHHLGTAVARRQPRAR